MGMSQTHPDVDERTRRWVELADRQRITELVMRRGRAADAKDPDAIVALHVPGSRDSHGLFDGTIEQFADYLRTHNYADERYGLQRHTICHVWIEFDGPDEARAETYHLAYHHLTVDLQPRQVYVGGRYLDHCTKLDGRWLLSTRTVVYDWSTSHATHGRSFGGAT